MEIIPTYIQFVSITLNLCSFEVKCLPELLREDKTVYSPAVKPCFWVNLVLEYLQNFLAVLISFKGADQESG